MKEQKKQPELRFKGFTDDWEQVKLKDIVIMFDENRIPIEHEKRKSGKYPYYGASGIIDYVDNYIFEGEFVLLAEDGANIIMRNTPIAYLTNGRFWVNNHAHIMSMINGSNLFLLQILEKQNYIKYNSGTAQPKLNSATIRNIIFNLPKDKEQKRIGEFFQKLDQTITLQQRKLDLLKKLKQGYLQQMFPAKDEVIPQLRFSDFYENWKLQKLGDIAKSFSGGTPSVGNKEYYNGKIPFIRSAEINKKETELFLTENGLANSSAKLVSQGTILYALYGATSGEVGISHINGAINQAILAIMPSDGYSTLFIVQWLRNNKKKITDKYIQGGQGNLSGAIIKDLQIEFPSKKEQKLVGEFFNKLDQNIALQHSKIGQLNKLKQAYLQKLFP